MNYLKGLVKGTVVFIILCLATYGAFVLFKRPPELTVSEEDRTSLQKDHGIEILSNDTTGGRSALFNTISGVPPIGAKPSGVAKSTIPAGIGGTSPSSSAAPFDEAPSFAASSATAAPALASSANSTAPLFAATPAVSEAPPFNVTSNASEAPPFVATSPPPAPPAAVIVQPAPLYGSQHPSVSRNEAAKPAPSPGVSQSEAAKPISTPAPVPVPVPANTPPLGKAPVPNAVSSPPTAQTAVPAPAPPKPSEKISLPTIPPTAAGSPWDGPAASVADSTPTSAENPWGETPSKPEVIPTAGPAEKKESVAFVAPKIKPLPKIEEEPPIQVLVAAPIPRRPEPTPQSIATNTAIPEEYRQASIRRISVAPPPDEAPVVSFSPINVAPKPTPQDILKNEPPPPVGTTSPSPALAPEKNTSLPPTSTSSAPVATPSFVEPKVMSAVAPIESAPFPVEDPISAESVETLIVSLPTPPSQLKSEIREPVVRFVTAQCELIRSNSPEKIRAAYIQLSRLYDHPELNVFERAYLTPILDHLAVDVIFSKRNNILEAPYIVRAGETAYTLRSGEVLTVPYGNSIDSIAATFNLTPSLLMKINGLTNKRPLEAGTELKVILGHFDAKVSTERREFTLILGGLYAGRFPIAVGEEIQNVRGDFTVTFKGDTPQGRSLTLSNGITMRGVDKPQPGDSLRSAIRFSERDAVELFDILSERSVVVVAK